MAGAFAYDIYKNRDVLDASAMGEIAVGFVMAFISAVFVVRWVLDYISRYGYALFGWWRIPPRVIEVMICTRIDVNRHIITCEMK